MAIEYKETFVNASFGHSNLLGQVRDELCRRGRVIDTITEYYGAFGDIAGYRIVSHSDN